MSTFTPTPTPLTKEFLYNYKYLTQVSRFAIQIRDTLCSDIEKGNIKPSIHTKYAYKLDETSPQYKAIIQSQTDVQEPLQDIINSLQQLFPDSKIRVVDKEILNGFILTKSIYIEIDWS